MSDAPISRSKPLSRFARICFILGGLALMVIGAAITWISTINPWIDLARAQSWPGCEAVVTSSRVEAHSGDEGTTYSAEISFSYDVGNQQFSSDNYEFNEWSGSQKKASRIVAENPVGRTITCFYNPEFPDQAVVVRRFNWTSLLGLLFLILFGFFGVVLFSVGASKGAKAGSLRKKTRSPLLGNNQSTEKIETKEFLNLFPTEWEGAQRLVPVTSRGQKLVNSILFAAIWNGITGTFIYFAIKDEAGWGLLLFSSLFAIIGLGLISNVFYSILAMSNPVVELAISNRMPKPGETIDIAWETTGNASRFQNLQISIIGEESATYSRGTDRVTDTDEFCEFDLANTADPKEMEFGQITLRVPHDCVPSFKADNNAIHWKIVIHGDIPRWPDVNEEFEIRVKPK